VTLANPLGHLLVGNGIEHNRQDALVHQNRVLDLLVAETRSDGVRADDEDEGVTALDRRAEHRREDLSGTDSVYVDPGVLAVLVQGLGKTADELRITTGVRNENVRHVHLSPRARRRPG